MMVHNSPTVSSCRSSSSRILLLVGSARTLKRSRTEIRGAAGIYPYIRIEDCSRRARSQGQYPPLADRHTRLHLQGHSRMRGQSMEPGAIPADASTSRGVYDSMEAVRSLLIEGEQLEACAIQRRLFALKHRRKLVAATTGRLIIVERGLFGGFHPTDLRWQDLRDATLDV